MKTYLFLMVLSAWVVAAFAGPTPSPDPLKSLREQSAAQDKIMHELMCKNYPAKCVTPTPTPHG